MNWNKHLNVYFRGFLFTILKEDTLFKPKSQNWPVNENDSFSVSLNAKTLPEAFYLLLQ